MLLLLMFAGVVLDESSVLKNYTGSTKRYLVEAFAEDVVGLEEHLGRRLGWRL